jgi:hypothetical protein
MGIWEMHTEFWSGNVKGRHHSEDTSSHERIILKRILGIRGGGGGRWRLNSCGAGPGPVAGGCEHGNEPSGFPKGWGISWLAERMLASQQGFCSMELRTMYSRDSLQEAERTTRKPTTIRGNDTKFSDCILICRVHDQIETSVPNTTCGSNTTVVTCQKSGSFQASFKMAYH